MVLVYLLYSMVVCIDLLMINCDVAYDTVIRSMFMDPLHVLCTSNPLYICLINCGFLNCYVCRFEKILKEMLNHLERQPRNKDRRVAWLNFIEPLFNALGLLLLAHFRHMFPLFFQWMHADDDETVLLV